MSHCLVILGFSIHHPEVFTVSSFFFFFSFHCKLGIWFPEARVCDARCLVLPKSKCFVPPEPYSISCRVWGSYRCNVCQSHRQPIFLLHAWPIDSRWRPAIVCIVCIRYIVLEKKNPTKQQWTISLITMTVNCSWKGSYALRYSCYDYAIWFSVCAFQTFKLRLLQRIKKRKNLPIQMASLLFRYIPER